jgi:hypothetical protein
LVIELGCADEVMALLRSQGILQALPQLNAVGLAYDGFIDALLNSRRLGEGKAGGGQEQS